MATSLGSTDIKCKLNDDLSPLSFEELQNLKDHLGCKVYSEAIFGARTGKRAHQQFNRANKNRPREESSKRPAPAVRDVFNLKKEDRRDPRFDENSGAFNERVFRHTYRFLDKIKQKEKGMLERELQKEVDNNRKSELKSLLTRMGNQERAEKLKQEKLKKKQEERKEIMDQLKEGKKPIFMKKAEKRKLELAERYQTLKKAGKLEKYIQKKRKKNAAKDRKHFPAKS